MGKLRKAHENKIRNLILYVLETLKLVMRRAAEKAVNIRLKAKKQIIEKLHDDANMLSQLKTSSLSAGLDTTEPIISRESDIKEASFRKRYIELTIPKTPSTRPMRPNNLSNLYIFKPPFMFTQRSYF